MHRRVLAGLTILLAASALSAGAPASPKDALQAFNDLIGAWRGTGTPTDSRERFWTETLNWEWQFKGKDAWLKVDFDKSKHFTAGELRHVPDRNEFALTLKTPTKETLTFTGPLRERVLTLERKENDERQRIVVTLLHPNRFLYRYEVQPAGKTLFRKVYQVGATKEGVPFAGGDGKPECVVSGGLGTTPVAYLGKTYYVCCSGCRDEFNDNPAKYVKEFEAKKAKKK